MSTDHAAQAHLENVVLPEWQSAGVIDPLRSLVASVWRKDLDRYEPRLGDDAVTLGIQASRNICNLAVPMLVDLPGVKARDVRTLEIAYGGKVLHIGKVPSTSESWPVEAMTWERDVRRRAAEANSKVFVSLDGTLLAEQAPLPGQPADPGAMTDLFMSWQGLNDGRTNVWLGFPSAEDGRAWYAVVQLGDDPGDGGGLPAPLDDLAPTDSNFDELGETPLPPMARRNREERSEPDA